MTLFDYYLQYMTELLEGKRPAPEGITLPEGGEEQRVQSLGQQLQAMGMASFVRACAAQDGTELSPSLFDDDGVADFGAFLQNAGQTAPDPKPPEPAQDAADDPDAHKHAFEVFLDCIAMDDGLVQYLIDVLKRMDRKEFFKLSQITTKLDLDPEEFLYWLAHRQDYAGEELRREIESYIDTNVADIDDYEKEYDRMEQDNERLADHQRSVFCNIREEVDALDTLLHDTRLNRARMQGAVRIIQQMINREL